MTANVQLSDQGGSIDGPDLKWPGWFGTEIDASSVTIKTAKPKEAQKSVELELQKLMARKN